MAWKCTLPIYIMDPGSRQPSQPTIWISVTCNSTGTDVNSVFHSSDYLLVQSTQQISSFFLQTHPRVSVCSIGNTGRCTAKQNGLVGGKCVSRLCHHWSCRCSLQCIAIQHFFALYCFAQIYNSNQ